MKKEATLDQWKQLYDLAIDIKKMKPWEKMSDRHLIVIEQEDHTPVYFCIMGNAGISYGISTYIGQERFNSLLATQTLEDSLANFAIWEIDNLTCDFDFREYVSEESRDIIKQLGLRFRGKNNWIHFTSRQPGYLPSIPDAEEVATLIPLFDQLKTALIELEEKDYTFYDGSDAAYYKSYDKATRTWTAKPQFIDWDDLALEYEVITQLDIPDHLLNMKPTSQIWEFDIAYLGTGYPDETTGRFFNMIAASILDQESLFALTFDVLHRNDDFAIDSLDLLLNSIEDHGMPKEVHIRNPRLFHAIKDTCKRIHLPIKIASLDNSDAFLMEMMEMMNQSSPMG